MSTPVLHLFTFLFTFGIVPFVASWMLRGVIRRCFRPDRWETFYQGADERPPEAGWEPFAVHTEPRDRDSGQVYTFVHYRRRLQR